MLKKMKQWLLDPRTFLIALAVFTITVSLMILKTIDVSFLASLRWRWLILTHSLLFVYMLLWMIFLIRDFTIGSDSE